MTADMSATLSGYIRWAAGRMETWRGRVLARRDLWGTCLDVVDEADKDGGDREGDAHLVCVCVCVRARLEGLRPRSVPG